MHKFNPKTLSAEAQHVYQAIVKEKMQLGDPLPLVQLMFE